MNEREKGHWTTCIWFKSWIIDSKLKIFEYLNWWFRIWTGCRSFSDLSNSLNWNNAGNKNLGLEENTLFLYLSVFASKIIIIRISVHFILLHKTYWVDSALGSPNWTSTTESMYSTCSTGTDHAIFRLGLFLSYK